MHLILPHSAALDSIKAGINSFQLVSLKPIIIPLDHDGFLARNQTRCLFVCSVLMEPFHQILTYVVINSDNSFAILPSFTFDIYIDYHQCDQVPRRCRPYISIGDWFFSYLMLDFLLRRDDSARLTQSVMLSETRSMPSSSSELSTQAQDCH